MRMINILYFVRHGHYKPYFRKATDKSEKDGPLTLQGLEDIVELAHKIKEVDKSINHIYTSPFQRTRETADLLARVINRYATIRENLHEQHTQNNTREHYEEIYKEFNRVVEEALENNDGNSIIVSHDLPISLYVSLKTGHTYEEIIKNNKLLDILLESDCIKTIYNGKEFIKYERI